MRFTRLHALTAGLVLALGVSAIAAPVTNHQDVKNIVNGVYSSVVGKLKVYKSSSVAVTIDGSAATANRTITLPDGNVTLTAGTSLTTAGGTLTGGLTFSGVSTELTTVSNEALTIAPNGTGDLVIDTDADSQMTLNGGGDGVDSLVLTDGDILISDGDLTGSGGDFDWTLDAADTASITSAGAATADALNVTLTGVGSDAQTIAVTQSDDADSTDTTAGLRVSATSSSTDADALVGIDLDDLTPGAALEYAIRYGAGWDAQVLYNDTTTILKVADGGTITWEDLAGTDIWLIADVSTASNHVLSGDADTGLVLSGMTTDLSTSTDEHLTLAPNGTGDVVIGTDADSQLTLDGGGDGVDSIVLTDGDILLSDGDLDLSGGDFNVVLDAGDGVNISKGGAATVDVLSVAGGTVSTDQVDAVVITMTTADGANLNNAGINMSLTAQGTAAGDTVRGIYLDLAAQAGGTEKAIEIENTAAWDTDLELQNDETIVNATDDQIVFSGGAGTNNASITFDLDGASASNVPAIVSGGSDLLTINDGLSVGIDGETTENMSNGGFAFAGGNDLYVDDMLGVNGAVYVDGVATLAGSADGTDALVVSLGDVLVSDGDLDLSGGDFNVTLDAADGASVTSGAAASADALTVTLTGVGSDGITAALTQSDDGDATDSSAALRVTATSSSGDADTLVGVDIDTLTGGSANESAIRIGSGWDTAIDLSGVTTGTGDIAIGDNLAEAAVIREGANDYMEFVTTDNSEAINSLQRLTTTDGVSGGTARIVGGRAYSSVAASTAITGTSEDETNFDTNYPIPANTLKAGTTITYDFQGIHTATTNAETHDILVKLGSTTIESKTGIDPANSDIFAGHCVITIRTAGAGGTMTATCTLAFGAEGTLAEQRFYMPETAVNTTGALTAAIAIDRQPAATDGDSARLDIFNVRIE